MSCATAVRSRPHLSVGAFSGQQPGSVMKPARLVSSQVEAPQTVPPPVELDDATVVLDAVVDAALVAVTLAVSPLVVPPPPCPPEPELLALLFCTTGSLEHAWTPPIVAAPTRANQAKVITRIDRLPRPEIGRIVGDITPRMQAFSCAPGDNRASRSG